MAEAGAGQVEHLSAAERCWVFLPRNCQILSCAFASEETEETRTFQTMHIAQRAGEGIGLPVAGRGLCSRDAVSHVSKRG